MDNKSYSKGISWIDDCRIPFVDGAEKPSAYQARKGGFQDVFVGGKTNNIQNENTKGRFPANILVSDDMLNDGIVSKGTGAEKMTINNHSQTESKYQYSKVKKQFSIADKGSNSRYYNIDKWFDKIIGE